MNVSGFFMHIYRDAPEYTALLGLLAVAVIANMPKPGSPVSWLTLYTWVYDSLQAFMAARNPHATETRIETSRQTSEGSVTTQTASTMTAEPPASAK